MADLLEDNRGLGAGIFRFLAVLGFFGILYGVLDLVALDLINVYGPTATNTDVVALQSYIQSAWVFLPAIVLFMAAIRLLARAIFESRGGVN